MVLENGESVGYDYLILNIGSRTRDVSTIPGVEELSISTRPINALLKKIESKESTLLETNTIPSVVICGAGCAGVELAFGFKARWTKLFNTEIRVSLISSHESPLPHENPALQAEVERKLKEKNIDVFRGWKVIKVDN